MFDNRWCLWGQSEVEVIETKINDHGDHNMQKITIEIKMIVTMCRTEYEKIII